MMNQGSTATVNNRASSSGQSTQQNGSMMNTVTTSMGLTPNVQQNKQPMKTSPIPNGYHSNLSNNFINNSINGQQHSPMMMNNGMRQITNNNNNQPQQHNGLVALSPEQQLLQQQYQHALIQKQLMMVNQQNNNNQLYHSPNSCNNNSSMNNTLTTNNPNMVMSSSPSTRVIPINTNNMNRNNNNQMMTMHGQTIQQNQSLSFSPRFTSILLETKNTMYLNDNDFLPIAHTLNQNCIKTSNVLAELSEEELVQCGVPPPFARCLWKRFILEKNNGNLKQTQLPIHTPQQPTHSTPMSNNLDQGSSNGSQNDATDQEKLNQVLMLMGAQNVSNLLMNNPQLISSLSPSQHSNSTTSPSQHQQQVITPCSQNSSTSTNNMNGLSSPNVVNSKLVAQQQQINNLLVQLQQQQQQQNMMNSNYMMTNSGVTNMSQPNFSSSFLNNNLFDTVNHNEMLTADPNSYTQENEFMIAGTSLNSAVNSNSLGSNFLSSSTTSSFHDIFGSAGSVMDVGMDHSAHRIGTSSSSMSSLLRNQDGSLPTSVSSSGKSVLLAGGSMGSNQSSLNDTLMRNTYEDSSIYMHQGNVVNMGFVRQVPTTSQTNFESNSSSSSSSTSPPGNSADHTIHQHCTSNILGGLSPEMDIIESPISGTVSYPCKVKTESQNFWPKIVSWFKREGDSERELFTVVISNDSSSGKTGTDKKKSKTGKVASTQTSPPNIESQDLLLDFRNKYIRISLTEGGKENLIKVERVGSQPTDDVWGFLITDTSKGMDFIEELKTLGFPEDSYTLNTSGTFPPQKQVMGFERLPTEQGGMVQAKQDDQILLMRFPRYAEPVKGIRKKKLLLIKYRFVHSECAYSFYSLFNLRKENHNAAMSTDDIWISSLFIEKDVHTSPMRIQRSPINPSSEPVTEAARGSSSKQKRTCDWETADANQLQFISNSPTVGKGGVDVVCKLDLSFEGNSMKRKFVADPSIESEMFLVEATKHYDFIEKGFFKIVRVIQQIDHVDLVVRMPRPTKETTAPQTIFFRVLYNMKVILDNPQTRYQGKFTYEPIDKEELSNQATAKLLEFYQMYSSQFSDDVKKLIADKVSNQIHNVTFEDMEGIQPKQYSNLYVQFTELHYRDMTDDSNMDEEEFIKAVNSLGHESRDIYGFTLLTHFAFRGMKKHCRILMNRFGMSFESKDNLGVSVLEWCRLAHNPNNILELSYLEKAKTVPRHGIYTTTSPNINIKQPKKETTTGSSPPNSISPRKTSWFSGLFRNIFTSPSQNQIYFDEELNEETAQPLDMNVTSYDERLLSIEERQGIKFYLDKLKKLDEKISSKHGQGKSQEKSQAWKDLYLDENKTIEAQNAICKDRFVAKHYGKTMENLSKKHKDERKTPLMTVKVIVSDCTNDFRNSLFDLFRPNYKDNLFGAFHTGLLIGPWRFDFYDHSIVRVRGDYRVYRNEYTLAVIDVGSFNKVDNIKNALDTVASSCIEWNATKVYDPFKCNCQHFVTDVLSRLNLWSEKPTLSPFERYLEDLRKGRSERRFYFSDSIKALKDQHPESSYWENDHITFNSRKELNDFCLWLDGMKYFESEESVGDIKLLKSFDRSFCMQSMNPEEVVTNSDNSTIWFFSEDGTEFGNSLNKLVFNLPGVTFPQSLRV